MVCAAARSSAASLMRAGSGSAWRYKDHLRVLKILASVLFGRLRFIKVFKVASVRMY